MVGKFKLAVVPVLSLPDGLTLSRILLADLILETLTPVVVIATKQFLPIQWRSSFQVHIDSARATEDSAHGFHNRYTLDEVSPNSIPYVREVMNSVLVGELIVWSTSSQKPDRNQKRISCSYRMRTFIHLEQTSPFTCIPDIDKP